MRTHIVSTETFRYMLEWCWVGSQSRTDLMSAPSVPGYHSHVLGVWTHCPDCNGEYVEVNTLGGRFIDRCACYWARMSAALA